MCRFILNLEVGSRGGACLHTKRDTRFFTKNELFTGSENIVIPKAKESILINIFYPIYGSSRTEEQNTNRHIESGVDGEKVMMHMKMLLVGRDTGPHRGNKRSKKATPKAGKREYQSMGKWRQVCITSRSTSTNWALHVKYDAHSVNRRSCSSGGRNGDKGTETKDAAMSILSKTISTTGAC